MKKSGYKSVFHIYLIFFALLIGMIIAAIGMVLYAYTIQKPDGSFALSDWPEDFTRDFSKYIAFDENAPQVTPDGILELKKNNLWLQIINEECDEVYNYNLPQGYLKHYSPSQLLNMNKSGSQDSTIIIRSIMVKGTEFNYIIGFPVKISRFTSMVNGDRFTNGKTIGFWLIGIMLLLIIVSGMIYGLWVTKRMSGMTAAIGKIVSRSYTPIKNQGVYKDVYDSINTLNSEIQASDELRARNDKLREEWIANITHDLKTPLSPIKGYAELITDPAYDVSPQQMKKYGETILKNTAYAEGLIDDLKLTYQLENGMIPINKKEYNIVRFIREIVIDILNNPEYQSRNISFYCHNEDISMIFDSRLMKRALDNIIYNSLVHNSNETDISISIKSEDNIQICIGDNGKGMNKEELDNLFIRYYRGTDTAKRPEGTGLGMAIAKQVIELHGGSIYVTSELGKGSGFFIEFPR